MSSRVVPPPHLTPGIAKITVDLDTALLHEIGRVAVHYARLEAIVSQTIYRMLGLDFSEGRLFLKDERLHERVNSVHDIARMHGVTLQTDMTGIEKRLQEVSTYRNNLLHGLWLTQPDGPPELQVTTGTWDGPRDEKKIKRKFVPALYKVDAKQVRGICDEIDNLTKRVGALCEEAQLIYAQRSSPDKRSSDPGQGSPPSDRG